MKAISFHCWQNDQPDNVSVDGEFKCILSGCFESDKNGRMTKNLYELISLRDLNIYFPTVFPSKDYFNLSSNLGNSNLWTLYHRKDYGISKQLDVFHDNKDRFYK